MLCGFAAVYQALVMDGLSFDPFSFQRDGLAAPEVDLGRVWTRGTVHQILVNEKYPGHNVWNTYTFLVSLPVLHERKL